MKRKPKPNRMRGERTWNTINVSWDTYDNLMKLRQKAESMNTLLRRLTGMELPDPTRPKPKRSFYYDEDWE